MIWKPICDVPKDGTHVHLRIDMPDGREELDGAHVWLKRGAAHPRWYRVRDMAELVGLPREFCVCDESAQGNLL